MKSFYKSLKRQDGFTLVELMVVVAIIGLLSAVAVPNFKKYQSKAKASEAKLQLSAAYMAEQSFYSDFNLYANCLKYMGYDPAPEKTARYYAIGFIAGATNPVATTTGWVSAMASGLDNTANSGCAGGAAGAVLAVSLFEAGKGVGAVSINSTGLFATAVGGLTAATVAIGSLGTQADTANMRFNIGAAGVISPDFATAGTSSVFSISQAKVISNTRLGY